MTEEYKNCVKEVSIAVLRSRFDFPISFAKDFCSRFSAEMSDYVMNSFGDKPKLDDAVKAINIFMLDMMTTTFNNDY